eukprot:31544-Pelagococcus_subviridis.AAC.3
MVPRSLDRSALAVYFVAEVVVLPVAHLHLRVRHERHRDDVTRGRARRRALRGRPSTPGPAARRRPSESSPPSSSSKVRDRAR